MPAGWALLALSLWRPVSAASPGAFLRAEALRPGMVAVVECPVKSLPNNARLSGLSQEAAFYFYGTATALALLAIPLEMARGEQALRLLAPDGQVLQRLSLRVLRADYARQELKVGRLKSRLKRAASDAEHELFAEARSLSGGPPLWRGALIRPVEGRVTAGFGLLRSYNQGAAKWRHKGWDLRAPEGTPVLATAAGQVALARPTLALSGGTLLLIHGYGLSSAYYHLSRLVVEQGQSVAKGQLIAYSGSTGLATGPHLHFQLELRGIPVHPGQWIDAEALN